MNRNHITSSPDLPTTLNPDTHARTQEDSPRLTYALRNCMPDPRTIPQRLGRFLAKMCEPRDRSQAPQAPSRADISFATTGRCSTQQPADQGVGSVAARDSSSGVADDMDSARDDAIKSVPRKHPALPETVEPVSNPVSRPSVDATTGNKPNTNSSVDVLNRRDSWGKTSGTTTPQEPAQGTGVASPEDQTAQAQDQINCAPSTTVEATASLKTANDAAGIPEETSLPAQPAQAATNPGVTDEPTRPAMPPHRSTLQGAPLDVQLQIMDYLEPQDLISLRAASRLMKMAVEDHGRIIEASSFLQLAKTASKEKFQEGVDRLIARGRVISVPLSGIEEDSRRKYLLDACRKNRHAAGPNGERKEERVTHLVALSLLSPATRSPDYIQRIILTAQTVRQQNPNLQKFSLNLANSPAVTCQEAAVLVGLQALTHLDLTGTRLDVGPILNLIVALSDSKRLSKLSLKDTNCPLGIVGEAIRNANLRQLSLSGINLGTNNSMNLLISGNSFKSRLTHLDVSNTRLGWELAAEILNEKRLSGITQLNLQKNGFGAQEILKLLDALPAGTGLRKLYLRDNLNREFPKDLKAIKDKIVALRTAHPQLEISFS